MSRRQAPTFYKRCGCTDSAGKKLGDRCPKLRRGRGWNPNHGTWSYRIELDAVPGQKRRDQLRRSGFATIDEARDARDRALALLDLAPKDDVHTRRLIAETIKTATRGGGDLPKLEDMQRRLRTGQTLIERTTLAEYLDDWLERKAKTRKRSTLHGYRGHVKNFINPYLGHIRLDRLAVSHVEDLFDWIDERNEQIAANNALRRELTARIKEAGRTKDRATAKALREELAQLPPYQPLTGPTTKQRIRATLRSALNSARKARRIDHNPAADIELPGGKRPKPLVWTDERIAAWRKDGTVPGTVMVWTPALTGAFLERASRDRLHALFHIAAFRGLRRGELCGLHWADIDFSNKTLTVRWQIVQVGWETHLEEPKTDDSARVIALDDDSLKLLRTRRRRQASEQLAAGSTWQDTGLVFTHTDGSALHPQEISDLFHALLNEADLPPIRLHDLRHGAATLALATNTDMNVVKEMLGHSTVNFTRDTYTSVLPEIAYQAAEAVTDLVRRSTDSGPQKGKSRTKRGRD